MRTLLFTSLLFQIVAAKAQTEIRSCLKNNAKISYTMFRSSPVFSDSTIVVDPKNLVRLSISKDCKNQSRQISTKEWLALLNDDNSDWIANLLLYELYERDATIFIVIKRREDWVSTYKDSDIIYWKEKLQIPEVRSP
ncbi:MAG TPA: hypothetical protein VF476_15585 [Chitinophagaceae bacterium]